MNSLAAEIKNFLMTGCIDNIRDISPADVLSLGDIASVVSELCSEFNDFGFREDKSLDLVSQFGNADIVKDQYVAAPHLEALLGGLLFSQPWMTRQGCALSAMIHKQYKFQRQSNCELYQGFYSWPCLIDKDHRIVIPARSESDFLFVVCDEYFGVPDGVFNFRDHTFFTHGWSPITRHLKEGLVSMLKSITAWYFYSKIPALNHLKEASASKKGNTCLLIGGALNPSHIIWNYIGGLELAARAGKQEEIDFIVQTSDLYYPLHVDESKHVNLYNLEPLQQIQELAQLGFAHSLFVRLSDAGNNPKVCEQIRNRSISKIARSLGVSPGIQPHLPNSLHPSNSKPVRIVVSIRTGRRKIVEQVNFFVEIFASLIQALSKLEIIFDGSAVGPSSNQEREIEIAREIADAFSSKHQQISTLISFEHAIGETMEYQSLVYNGADSYVTYFSGGNAKILNFINGIGILMTPSSSTSAKYLRRFGYNSANGTALSQDISACVFNEDDVFVVSHDYEGYSSELLPPLLCTGDALEGSIESNMPAGYDKQFHGDFVLDPDAVAKQLIKCINYNRLLNASFRGLPLWK